MTDRRKMVSLFNPGRRRGSDRRANPRYDTGELAVRFTWELGGQRGEGRGVLCNIGQGGICLVAYEAPPRGVRLSIHLEGHPDVPPAEGAVAHVHGTRLVLPGPVVVGLRLAAPCPYEFFSAVVSQL